MKVLWLVSITIPAAADACGLQAKEIGGGWLSGALGGMTAAPDAPAITVASVDARAETLTVCSKNGVSFALVPTGSVENFSALLKKIVPDLVHIWGTEYAAARTMQQAAQAAGVPVLVGILFTLLHALIQAYVLTMLTALFYGEVSEHPEPEPRKNAKAATGRT